MAKSKEINFILINIVKNYLLHLMEDLGVVSMHGGIEA
jgi:hypothetical protein